MRGKIVILYFWGEHFHSFCKQVFQKVADRHLDPVHQDLPNLHTGYENISRIKITRMLSDI